MVGREVRVVRLGALSWLRTFLAICMGVLLGATAGAACAQDGPFPGLPEMNLYSPASYQNPPQQWYQGPAGACAALIQYLDTRIANPFGAPGLACPGATIVGGCPTWAAFVPATPLDSTHVGGGTGGLAFHVLPMVPVSRTSCAPQSTPDTFSLMAQCNHDAAGTTLLFVGNGECRCPNNKVMGPTGSCVTSCPQGTTAQNGVCLADGPKAAGPSCPTCGTNPINVGTASKVHVERVYDSQVAGGVSFALTYNSQRLSYPVPARVETFGKFWTGSWERQVFYVSGTGSATVRRPDGREIEFRPDANGNYLPDADIKDTLIRLVDTNGATTGWQYKVQADDSVEEYEPTNGLLQRITFRSGLQQLLTYSDGSTSSAIAPKTGLLIEVTDSFGRTIAFNYDTRARVVGMTDPAGGHYSFQYSANSATGTNLLALVYPDTKQRSFAYGEAAFTSGATLPNSLTGVTDENGVRYATFSYDAQGRATSSQHAGGVDHVTIVNNADGSRTVTDPRSTVRTLAFQSVLGVPKSTGISGAPAPSYGPASQVFDANGNVASKTDWNGNRTNYQYDLTRNLETQRVEGLTSAGGTTAQTRTISTQWDATFRLPTGIAEPLRITTNTYDADGTQCGARGALCSRTVQATSDTSGAQGFTATLVGSPRTWTYTYNANGSVLTVNGPRTDVSDVTTYTYYANNDADVGKRGNVATITNAANQITQITSYNGHGQPLTIVDANGLTTTLAYDARQRLTSRTVGSEVTSYEYDATGQLKKVTLPDASYLSYTYDDAHRLTAIQDNLGNRISYTLDVMGNRTLEQVFDPANTLAQTRSREYNSLNRLLKDIGAVATEVTQYAYDDQGNVTSVTNPLSKVTSNQYDALNRLKQVTDPALGVTQYAYNGLDALTQVTDPRNLATAYTVDGLGNLTLQASPDTGNTSSSYDAAGNLLTQTDAKSQVTTYTYDALNRVTLITFHDGSKQTYAYDLGTNGIGRLSSITETSASNVQTGQIQFSYDLNGRVTSEARTVAGVAYVVAYSYDSAGRLSGMTYPSGRTVSYGFDSLGRVNQVNTTKPGETQVVLVQNAQYQPFGGVKSFTLGNGQIYSRSIDQDGRIASYTLGSTNYALTFDDASRITGIGSSTYGYDDLDRLTSAVLASSNFGYSYDAVGNRLTKVTGANTDTYAYSSTSNRLSTLTPATGPQRSFTFDANGSTTNDGINTYAYDTRGRMTSATSSAGTANYQVNALGQRVKKSTSSGDTVFHYDLRGRLIAETDASGALKRELFYLGDIPVAVYQ